MPINRADALLAALAQGPCLIGAWAARAGFKARDVEGSIQWLLLKRRVIVIGTLEQARAAGVAIGGGLGQERAVSNVYALPGTPPLPPLPLPRAGKSRSGSGVIAGPKEIRGYLW